MSSVRLARTLVAAMVAQGVRHVVLAPGSRNAPLALALARAQAEDLVELHVRLDERSAGFIALGAARGTAAPVAVVTTSGTAVGNLVPAVMEARHAGVPLLVVSADRPSSMINSGANQTTGQLGIFAQHALDISRVSSQSGDEAAWSRAVRRAVVVAAGMRTRQPGPVHLNVELAAPLVDDQINEPLAELLTPGHGAGRLAVQASVPSAALEVDCTRRTVVLAGDGSPDQGAAARGFAEAAGLPLLAEPSSNARQGTHAIAAYRLVLADLGDRIEQVVVFGHPTLSRSVTALLGRADVDVVVVSSTAEWIDPGHRAVAVVDAVVPGGIEGASGRELGRELGREAGRGAWLQEWREADARVSAGLDADTDREVDRSLNPGLDPGLDPRVVAVTLWSALGAEDLVLLGSSNPIRDADLVPVPAVGAAATVHANRGLSGIDGTISTALGLAWGSGRHVTAIMGDLTFLHDLSGLVMGRWEQRPDLRVVVLDDAGGSIFHGLEQGGAAHAEHFERVFATPQDVDLEAAARGLGASVSRAESREALGAALADRPRGIEVIIVPVDRSRRPRPT